MNNNDNIKIEFLPQKTCYISQKTNLSMVLRELITICSEKKNMKPINVPCWENEKLLHLL
jgi:hypothetical protein